jgi:hypothetical protein
MTALVYCPGVCRECGCTEERACVDDAGASCFWVEPDLCSACAEDEELDDLEVIG